MPRWIPAVLLLAACGEGGLDTLSITDTDVEVDVEGPVITHEPIQDPQVYGNDVLIEATVDDDSGVFTVQVVYKHSTGGDGDWKSKVMNSVSSGFYQGRILGKDHASSGIRYYIEAIDAIGNVGCLPDTDPCGQESWYFPLSAD